jgi:hypothetical protein
VEHRSTDNALHSYATTAASAADAQAARRRAARRVDVAVADECVGVDVHRAARACASVASAGHTDGTHATCRHTRVMRR